LRVERSHSTHRHFIHWRPTFVFVASPYLCLA
jgi:hypothetical protein